MANILILEHDLDRIDKFIKYFMDTNMVLFITDRVVQAIEVLEQNKIDLAYLTHDLDDKGLTGFHAAEYLAKHPSVCPATIFIHATNSADCDNMAKILSPIANTQAIIAPFPACITQYQVAAKDNA